MTGWNRDLLPSAVRLRALWRATSLGLDEQDVIGDMSQLYHQRCGLLYGANDLIHAWVILQISRRSPVACLTTGGYKCIKNAMTK